MEDILGIVVVILVYAFVLRGKNKGKKKKNSKGAVKNPAGRGADRAAAFRQAFSEIPPASAPVQEGERRPAQIRTKLEEEMHAREAEGKASGPVSYTHLDVYKRQRPICLLNFFVFFWS